jgi:hypothetical protein
MDTDTDTDTPAPPTDQPDPTDADAVMRSAPGSSADSDSDSDSNSDSDSDSDSDTITYTPLPAVLVAATHPLRALIHPGAYGGIYTRVAVHGATPAVPINLADMTRALICGWKQAGEWPVGADGQPVGGADERADRARRRARAVEKGVVRMRRVLGL